MNHSLISNITYIYHNITPGILLFSAECCPGKQCFPPISFPVNVVLGVTYSHIFLSQGFYEVSCGFHGKVFISLSWSQFIHITDSFPCFPEFLGVPLRYQPVNVPFKLIYLNQQLQACK